MLTIEVALILPWLMAEGNGLHVLPDLAGLPPDFDLAGEPDPDRDPDPAGLFDLLLDPDFERDLDLNYQFVCHELILWCKATFRLMDIIGKSFL